MSDPKKTPWLLAAISAVGAGILLWAMVTRCAHIGGEGADFWGYVFLVTEGPGSLIAEEMFGSASPMVPILGGVSGAVECFAVFWIGIALFRGMSRRSEA